MSVYKWSRLLALLFILSSLSPLYPVNAEAQGETQPSLSSEAAVLIDAKTGTVLYASNADKQEYPASITKIITGIVAIEQAQNLSELVTVSKDARNEQGTRIYLAEGEQVPLINLLYGMLMNSGNDAATAIAEYIDGSKGQFAERMNAFVREKVGVEHTHFVNPSGLPDPQQYTTAMDMALIARYAMGNELFRTIVGTKRMPWNGKEWQSTLINHNEMLGKYEGATGIKNGYTSDSGFTLVTSARRNGMELIGVLLKAPKKSVLYKEMTQLLDYGFQHYELQKVMAANQLYPFTSPGMADFVQDGPLYAIVPKGETPLISVSEDGEVRVQTSLGTASAGRLRPTAPSLPLTLRAGDARLESRIATASTEPAAKSKKTFIFFVWTGLLLYLSLVAVIRIKRRRVERDGGY